MTALIDNCIGGKTGINYKGMFVGIIIIKKSLYIKKNNNQPST